MASSNLPIAANGSGWSCNYGCLLYTGPVQPLPKTSFEDGFLFRLRLFHFVDLIYLKKYISRKNHNRSTTFYFPPVLFSTLDDVDTLVSRMLEDIGVPATEKDSLVRLMFCFGRRHIGRCSGLVPLCLDFKIVTVLRNWEEGLDWFFGGTMGSAVVKTLRASKLAVKALEKTKFGERRGLVEKCMVCLEEFEEEEEVSWMPCKHGFHGSCVGEWLRSNHRCPICRFSLPWVCCLLDDDIVAAAAQI